VSCCAVCVVLGVALCRAVRYVVWCGLGVVLSPVRREQCCVHCWVLGDLWSVLCCACVVICVALCELCSVTSVLWYVGGGCPLCFDAGCL